MVTVKAAIKFVDVAVCWERLWLTRVICYSLTGNRKGQISTQKKSCHKSLLSFKHTRSLDLDENTKEITAVKEVLISCLNLHRF